MLFVNIQRVARISLAFCIKNIGYKSLLTLSTAKKNFRSAILKWFRPKQKALRLSVNAIYAISFDWQQIFG
jgi:hypothetical protein